MDIIDRGSGPPLVLIPGLQGRWEYLRPAVDALSVYERNTKLVERIKTALTTRNERLRKEAR